MVLFGTTEGGGDIVVTVVQGPRQDQIVRRKAAGRRHLDQPRGTGVRRRAELLRGRRHRPLEEIARPDVLARHEIGPAICELGDRRRRLEISESRAFQDALIRNKQE